MKMDIFFGNKEEEEQKVQVVAATVPVPVAVAAKMIRCDDCNRLVPEEEAKVWLAPVAVEEYEGQQDAVYMCKRCTKIFLDDNREYNFEDLLYSVEGAVRKYNPQVLENWK